MAHLRESVDGRERLIKILIRAARPRELQEMLRAEVQNEAAVGKSLKLFHTKLKACATMVDRVLSCQRKIAKQGKFKPSGSDKKSDITGKKRLRPAVIDEEKGKNISCYNCHTKGHPKRLGPNLIRINVYPLILPFLPSLNLEHVILGNAITVLDFDIKNKSRQDIPACCTLKKNNRPEINSI